MKIPFVDLKAQYLSIKPEIDKVIKNTIDNTRFIGGYELEQFSNTLSTQLNAKHALTVANGTDAIYIALRMLGIQSGDEVITSAHSWISTSETISYPAGQKFRIGSRYTGHYGSSNLFAVHIYNKALTANEVRQNYLSTKERYA